MADSDHTKRNRLALEKSPYLLQHAGNPVDWYPWGPAAFERAKKEDRPVFLSIGYSTCHWCHVMAHESFEDAEVARLMNDAFVSVKVDREERPDIDSTYMAVCQMMTGSGGWPLTVIMTPDRKPFYAGTYFPKETRYGRIGLLDLIPRIKDLWSSQRSDVLRSAEGTTAALQREPPAGAGEEPGQHWLDLAFEELGSRYDKSRGGFGTAPKFPTPHNLLFLLRYWKRSGKAEALEMVERTLQAMRSGGIYDHIGYGFHRYSTDARWLVPHFEKMLYDQALLTEAYVEAYQATGRQEYADTARGIISYVLRDMTAAEGGFYSAEDADSEGIEGKFYVWTAGEASQAAGPDDAPLVLKAFNITEAGNYAEESTGSRTGANIPHVTASPEQLAAEFNTGVPEFLGRLDAARHRLFQERGRRVRPGRDDKVLADWNGLMISAMAGAGRVLNEPDYVAAAERAAGFVLGTMADAEGRLLHRYRQGEAAIPGNLDDYAFMIHGLLELYESTFETGYLKRALSLVGQTVTHFLDTQKGGFFFTSDEAEELIVRQKEIYDGAVPSGNSVLMLDLLRLARITADSSLETEASRIGRAFSGVVGQSPSAYTRLMLAVDYAAGPSHEVVIAGDPQADDTVIMLRGITAVYAPNKVVLLLPSGIVADEITQVAPFTAGMGRLDGRATAYVCVDHACRRPTTNPSEAAKLLG